MSDIKSSLIELKSEICEDLKEKEKIEFGRSGLWEKIEDNDNVLYLILVRCFAQFEGFKACKSLFESKLEGKDVVFVSRVLKALHNMSSVMTKKQKQATIKGIGEYALKAQDKLKTDNQKYYDKYMKYAKEFAQIEGGKVEIIEENINDIIEMLQPLIKLKGEYPNGFAENLVNEYKKKDIVNLILSESKDIKECLKICIESDFFTLMYKWKALTIRHIESIWKKAINEEYYAEILISLIEILSIDDYKALIKNVKELNIEQCNLHTASVLMCLTSREFKERKKSKKNKLYESQCIDSTFALIVGERFLNKDVQDYAVNEFIKLTSNYTNDNILAKYFTECEELVAKDYCIRQMSYLYVHLAEVVNKETTVPYLFLIIVVNILNLKLKATEDLISKASSNSIEVLSEVNAKSYSTYYQELQARFNILLAIITRTKHDIQQEAINILYESFTRRSISKEERSIFFNFIQAATKPYGTKRFISAKNLDFLFYAILLKINSQSFDVVTLECLINTILIVNAHYNKITLKDNTFFADTIELIGVVKVWDIAFISEDASNTALDFLLTLYKQLNKDFFLTNGRKIKNEYIEKCLARVKSLNEQIEKGKNKSVENKSTIKEALRAIELLERFIDIKASNNEVIENVKYKENITVKWNDKDNKREGELNSLGSITLNQLLHQIRQGMGANIETNNWYLSNIGVLVPSEVPLADLHCPPVLEIFIEKNIETKPNTIEKLKNVRQDLEDDVYAIVFTNEKGLEEKAKTVLNDASKLQEIKEVVNKRNKHKVKEEIDDIVEIIVKNIEYFIPLYVALDVPSLNVKIWEIIKKLLSSRLVMNDMISQMCKDKERVPTLLEFLDYLLQYAIEKLDLKTLLTKNDTQLIDYFELIMNLCNLKLPKIQSFLQKESKQVFRLFKKVSIEIFDQIEGFSEPTYKYIHKPLLNTAFNLLIFLSSCDSQCKNKLLQCLERFDEETKANEAKYKNIVTKGNEKHYVGLKNVGFTCFINAMLQQLFMIPVFRHTILNISSSEIDSQGDDVVYNLQQIFKNLLLSDQECYMPDHFYKSFKWSDGNPINVNEQHDTDEFFNILIDKLEIELKESKYKNLLRDIMGIELESKIESLEKDKPYNSKKDESTLKLLLEIKGYRRLEDALNNFFKAEILEGDDKMFCYEYDTKLRIEKQYKIKTAAQILMIQLKRFDFNKRENKRDKITDFCSFPMELDIGSWTLNEDKNQVYELVGIFIHKGTVDGGHYYTIIKEKNKDSRNHNKWFKFDDANVDSFNPDSIPDICFGKARPMNRGNDLDWETSIATAYLLVYQQKTIPQTFQNKIEHYGPSNTNMKIVMFIYIVVL